MTQRRGKKSKENQISNENNEKNDNNGTAENNSDKKTPYQGNRKTFGFFRCTECDRSWASAHSWANTSQRCLNCDEDVYPYIQVNFKYKNLYFKIIFFLNLKRDPI